MGIAPQRVITLFNPVDVNWFHQFAESHRSPVTPGHKFLFVGRLISLKNVRALIEAFAQIRKESDTLTIAGDGELSSELKSLASTLGISDSVHFLGHKNQLDLAGIYSSSSTLILPSTNEVWGLVVNEALASGLHAVVSDLCGVSEFVEKMQGCYISQSDPSSLADAMKASRQSWKGYIKTPEILEYTR